MKYKNIFITGSTGVVGKPIFLKLINQGHNVFALSRNTKNEDFIRTNKAEVVNGDLSVSYTHLTLPTILRV